jgi:sigma-E factor negative regulatory protein RseA
MMSESSKQAEDAALALSALHDGETEMQCTSSLCAAWAQQGSLAEDWHAWSLIGDVMRSEDLATSPQADQAFLLALRARLVEEPVVLAPGAGPERRADAAADQGIESLSIDNGCLVGWRRRLLPPGPWPWWAY